MTLEHPEDDEAELRATMNPFEDIICLDDPSTDNADEWLQSDVWLSGGELS